MTVISYWQGDKKVLQSLINKLNTYKITFPCMPKVGMEVNLDSFLGSYDLNNEEKEVWEKNISKKEIVISKIIINDGFLELVLRGIY